MTTISDLNAQRIKSASIALELNVDAEFAGSPITRPATLKERWHRTDSIPLLSARSEALHTTVGYEPTVPLSLSTEARFVPEAGEGNLGFNDALESAKRLVTQHGSANKHVIGLVLSDGDDVYRSAAASVDWNSQQALRQVFDSLIVRGNTQGNTAQLGLKWSRTPLRSVASISPAIETASAAISKIGDDMWGFVKFLR